MSLSARAVLAIAICVAAAAGTACAGGLLGKQYEYEEDLFLSLDGSATLVVNASVPALVALRGLELDLNPRARPDLSRIRTAYESPVTEVTRVSPPWRRAGRRFVQIRMTVSDVRRLSEVRPFAWSRYTLAVQNGHHVQDAAGSTPCSQQPGPARPAICFEQKVGASALRPGTLQNVGWNGSEIVAFRLHLPSRIIWHNSRDIDTNQPTNTRRGNILAWEQHLTDRLEGAPLDIQVGMDSQSILYRTLWLFAGAFAAAVAVLAFLIWFTMRKGGGEAAPSPGV
jgi:hypothetical protein